MAVFHGKRGAGSFTGLTFDIISWTLTVTADMAGSSVMDNSALGATKHWKGYVSGHKDWTAVIECVLPLAGMGAMTVCGTEAELTITIVDTGARIYKGNAICTGIGPSASATSLGACTLSFQGTDQLEENANV